MFDRMTPDQRESALSEYQRRADGTAAEPIHLKLA
jgi:hypothetical protein